jgi:hypothetical protein
MMDLNDAQKGLMSDADRQQFGKAGMTGAEGQARFANGEEGKLHKVVKSYLDIYRIYYETEPFGRRTAVKAGRPDFRLCYRGKFVGIELKTVAGVVSREQTETLDAIRAGGGIAAVCYSLQDVIDLLRRC